MEVVRVSNLAELESLWPQWSELARGAPFRSPEWLTAWWRHYGQADRGDELFALAVLDSRGHLAALAPWWLEHTASRGRVIRFLGDGEICSEYPTILCRPREIDATVEALAHWLTVQAAPGDGPDCWDGLHLSSMASDDLVAPRLIPAMRDYGNRVRQSVGLLCWRLELPGSWDDYLEVLSKSHRKQIRQVDRAYFESGRAVMRWVNSVDKFHAALNTLIDLHERRWRRRGRPGCFSSPRFRAFHEEVAPRLLDSDCLLLSWLELDGRAVAAEYHFHGAETVYAYQCGIDPDALEHQPGRLAHIATIRAAIERGDRWFDFLRGNERYKAHWRAAPRPTRDLQIVPARVAAQLRYGVLNAGENVMSWLKTGWNFASQLGMR